MGANRHITLPPAQSRRHRALARFLLSVAPGKDAGCGRSALTKRAGAAPPQPEAGTEAGPGSGCSGRPDAAAAAAAAAVQEDGACGGRGARQAGLCCCALQKLRFRPYNNARKWTHNDVRSAQRAVLVYEHLGPVAGHRSAASREPGRSRPSAIPNDPRGGGDDHYERSESRSARGRRRACAPRSAASGAARGAGGGNGGSRGVLATAAVRAAAHYARREGRVADAPGSVRGLRGASGARGAAGRGLRAGGAAAVRDEPGARVGGGDGAGARVQAVPRDDGGPGGRGGVPLPVPGRGGAVPERDLCGGDDGGVGGVLGVQEGARGARERPHVTCVRSDMGRIYHVTNIAARDQAAIHITW